MYQGFQQSHIHQLDYSYLKNNMKLNTEPRTLNRLTKTNLHRSDTLILLLVLRLVIRLYHGHHTRQLFILILILSQSISSKALLPYL